MSEVEITLEGTVLQLTTNLPFLVLSLLALRHQGLHLFWQHLEHHPLNLFILPVSHTHKLLQVDLNSTPTRESDKAPLVLLRRSLAMEPQVSPMAQIKLKCHSIQVKEINRCSTISYLKVHLKQCRSLAMEGSSYLQVFK